MDQKQIIVPLVSAGASATIAIIAVLTFLQPTSESPVTGPIIVISEVQLRSIASMIDSEIEPNKPIFRNDTDGSTSSEIREKIKQEIDKGKELNLANTLTHIDISMMEESDPGTWEFLGDQYFQENDYIVSFALYGKALEDDPDNARILSKLGLLNLIGNNFRQSFFYYDRSLEVDPTYVPSLSNLGFMYALIGENIKAEQAFNKALDINDSHIPLLNNMALYKALRGQYQDSLVFFQQIQELSPNNSKFLSNYELITSLNEQDKLEKSDNIRTTMERLNLDFNHSVALMSDDVLTQFIPNVKFEGNFADVDSMLLYAEQFNDNKMHDLAEWYYLQILQTHPSSPVARTGLAYTYESSHRFDDASFHYNEVLKANPNHLQALVGLGNVALKQYNLNNATNYYEQVLDSDPKNHNAMIGLGNVALTTGNFVKALDIYNNVLDMDEGNVNAIKATALAYLIHDDFDTASSFYATALDLTNNQDLDSLHGYGLTLTLAGKEDEAKAYLEKHRLEIDYINTAYDRLVRNLPINQTSSIVDDLKN